MSKRLVALTAILLLPADRNFKKLNEEQNRR